VVLVVGVPGGVVVRFTARNVRRNREGKYQRRRLLLLLLLMMLRIRI
jgi:hypothetical protein